MGEGGGAFTSQHPRPPPPAERRWGSDLAADSPGFRWPPATNYGDHFSWEIYSFFEDTK